MVIGLQQQARALGDPTRHNIYRYIVDARRPVGVAELTAHLQFNHNAIRQHLAKLLDAGLVIETTAPSDGPGRPRLLYTPSPAADSRWGVTGPYERLSRLLVEVISTGDAPEVVGRRVADEFRVQPSSGDAAQDVAAAMDRQGFEPTVGRVRGRTEVLLDHCPFASAAVVDRATICALHLGIAEGLVAGTETVVEELVGNEPRKAGCRIRLRDAPAAEAAKLTLRNPGRSGVRPR